MKDREAEQVKGGLRLQCWSDTCEWMENWVERASDCMQF